MDNRPDQKRGYFGIGIENASKPMNMGNLVRSAHAFGAHFVFTINARQAVTRTHADTSKTEKSLPWYEWQDTNDMALPQNCQLVGVELLEEAIDLPHFAHPRCAAYVLGPERGSLSPALVARCQHIIRIPTRFCINVQIAGAVVMYDRLLYQSNKARALHHIS
ncbi:MAG: RNA methyltransferase [Alphaproteobacteria bacterium]|nr:RNA methyltransferase [Alphaproteobacteria bacterium]MBE8219972.1 RNA methyltransferase [Alphaproteobacteria bacterium]